MADKLLTDAFHWQILECFRLINEEDFEIVNLEKLEEILFLLIQHLGIEDDQKIKGYKFVEGKKGILKKFYPCICKLVDRSVKDNPAQIKSSVNVTRTILKEIPSSKHKFCIRTEFNRPDIPSEKRLEQFIPRVCWVCILLLTGEKPVLNQFPVLENIAEEAKSLFYEPILKRALDYVQDLHFFTPFDYFGEPPTADELRLSLNDPSNLPFESRIYWDETRIQPLVDRLSATNSKTTALCLIASEGRGKTTLVHQFALAYQDTTGMAAYIIDTTLVSPQLILEVLNKLIEDIAKLSIKADKKPLLIFENIHLWANYGQKDKNSGNLISLLFAQLKKQENDLNYVFTFRSGVADSRYVKDFLPPIVDTWRSLTFEILHNSSDFLTRVIAYRLGISFDEAAIVISEAYNPLESLLTTHLVGNTDNLRILVLAIEARQKNQEGVTPEKFLEWLFDYYLGVVARDRKTRAQLLKMAVVFQWGLPYQAQTIEAVKIREELGAQQHLADDPVTNQFKFAHQLDARLLVAAFCFSQVDSNKNTFELIWEKYNAEWMLNYLNHFEFEYILAFCQHIYYFNLNLPNNSLIKSIINNFDDSSYQRVIQKKIKSLSNFTLWCWNWGWKMPEDVERFFSNHSFMKRLSCWIQEAPELIFSLEASLAQTISSKVFDNLVPHFLSAFDKSNFYPLLSDFRESIKEHYFNENLLRQYFDNHSYIKKFRDAIAASSSNNGATVGDIISIFVCLRATSGDLCNRFIEFPEVAVVFVREFDTNTTLDNFYFFCEFGSFHSETVKTFFQNRKFLSWFRYRILADSGNVCIIFRKLRDLLSRFETDLSTSSTIRNTIEDLKFFYNMLYPELEQKMHFWMRSNYSGKAILAEELLANLHITETQTFFSDSYSDINYILSSKSQIVDLQVWLMLRSQILPINNRIKLDIYYNCLNRVFRQFPEGISNFSLLELGSLGQLLNELHLAITEEGCWNYSYSLTELQTIESQIKVASLISEKDYELSRTYFLFASFVCFGTTTASNVLILFLNDLCEKGYLYPPLLGLYYLIGHPLWISEFLPPFKNSFVNQLNLFELLTGLVAFTFGSKDKDFVAEVRKQFQVELDRYIWEISDVNMLFDIHVPYLILRRRLKEMLPDLQAQ